MKTLCWLVFFIGFTVPGFAQTDSVNVAQQLDSLRIYYTAMVSGQPPEIDGRLDDPAWNQVPWGGGTFRQTSPDAGKAGSVETRFKILYDEKNLYIAFKNYDPEPKKIISRMSRRDGFEGDFVEINIDSYNDKRTAFSFSSSVSGVKGDEYVSNNGDNWDASWDPIWYLKTSIDEEGWIAEVRIPLSQLRFADKPELVWGIQIMRRFFRKQERSVWQYIPPNAAGWVHLFGELRGLRGIRPQKQLEVQPYIVAKTERFEKQEGNPYLTGSSSALDYGLDAKIGITSDITLDVTVNPDFGQVEADPSQLNLTAFELFFQERRPFFIEGNNILNFPLTEINQNNLFYSRRIGRSPQVGANPDPRANAAPWESIDDGVNEYVKPNNSTTILGAAKLTGKNKRGFSWGLLESVTAPERAEIDSLGFKRHQNVEPLTNYFIARAQQDINKGNSVVGAIFTATNRDNDDQRFSWLHKSAYTGGIDFLHHWKDRTYFVSGRGIVSRVNGSASAITDTQLSSQRFFQRPDNHYKDVDVNRTSLTGTGGQLLLGKKSGNLVGNLGLMWQSPELDLNDVGFLSQTDNIVQWLWMQYRIIQPRGITRSERYNINQWQEYDFGGKILNIGYNTNVHVQFKNFWNVGGEFTYTSHNASNADLRGGPAFRYPSSIYYLVYVDSDARKKLFARSYYEVTTGSNKYMYNAGIGIDVSYRPVNAFTVSVAPNFRKNRNEVQFVETAGSADGDKYVVGEIDQTTLRVVIRATLMLTPNLSVQYYGQPFGTAGRYSNFKSVTNATAGSYENRFNRIGGSSLTEANGSYEVDDNLDGVPDYSFGKPDFNFGQFRSNMVIRWEYIPGSTMFLVWSQERNGEFFDTHPEHDQYSFSFREKGHHVFLLKFTYRFVF